MAAGSSGGGGSQGIKAGRAYVEVGTDQAGLKAGLNAAKRAVLSFGKQLTAAGAVGLGLGAAIVGPIAESFREMLGHFDKFSKASDRTGATTEDLSALAYAAEQSDASLEDVANGAKFLQKNLLAASEGSDEAVEAFGRLGLKAEDLKGKALGEQFEMLADGMRSIPDDEKGAVLEKVLGKGARALLPMLKDGAAGLKALKKEAEETGSIISGEDAKNATRVGDAISKSWTAVKNTFLAVGAALLPQVDTIEGFASAFVGAVRSVKQFIDDNRQVILVVLGVGSGIAAAGAALLGLGLAITAATVAIGGLISAGSALLGVLGFLFSPVGLAIATAVVAAIVAIAFALEQFPELFDDLAATAGKAWGFFADTFGVAWQGVKDALAAGDLKLAWENALAGLDVAWKATVAVLTFAWVEFKDTFVDMWVVAVNEVEKMWNRLVVKLAVSMAEANARREELIGGTGQTADEWRARAKAIEDERVLDEKIADAKLKRDLANRKKVRDKSKEDALDELAQAQWDAKKLAAKAKSGAFVADMWKAWDFMVGTMPDEAKRKAAVAGLGNVRGQFGGYGAGSSLGVSGDSIQKQQLEQLEDINENTKEGRGLVGV